MLTLDNQVNANGFARATIADGLYITVAGGYLTGAAEGSILKGDTVILKAKLGAVNSAMTTAGLEPGKEVRLYEVAEYTIVSSDSTKDSVSVDGKNNVVTYDSYYADLKEVTQAPAGVTFDLGYHYVKESAFTSITKSGLVWNTYGNYGKISFNIYIDKITNLNGSACNEVEFQLFGGASFVSVVDATGKEVNGVYRENPYVILQKGQSYSIVINVNNVSNPTFSFGHDNKTCELYFYNVAIATVPANEVTITFVGGRDGGNAKIATVTGIVGETIVLPANPTYPGFTFAGWYTDYACTTPFTATTYSKDMMVYAKWTVDPAQSLTVMSFNVETDNTNKSLVIETIKENNPYVFGVQEANSSWMSTLNSNFGDKYNYVGEYRGTSSLFETNECNAIFYRKDLFTCVEYGTKWLSSTPDTQSKYEGANYNRIMTYVVLERISDGARFIYVNTHLDNGGDAAAENVRKGQVEILLQQIQKLYNTYGNLPTVVTGDFNTQGIANKTASYNAMINGGFTDSSRVAVEVEGDITTTYNNKEDGFSGVIFDYVFVSSDWADDIQTYKVCDAKRNGTYVSDHNAIISTIIFPTQN